MRNRLALGIAAVPFVLHLAALNNYDFFRDELYFIVCGRHPAFGYVDQPPLIPLLAAASQLGGESLWLLRILPALFHVGAVLAACAVVRTLGGGRSAQVVAGLATGTAPLLLGVTATLGTTAIEPLTWTLVAYAALRAVLRDQTRWWIVAGIVAGISLSAKYTIAFELVALVVGLAIAGPRSTFARRDFWLGVATAGAIAAPSLVWQGVHGWPFWELLQAGAGGKNTVLAPVPWLINQIVILNPLFAPLWIGGGVALVTWSRTRFLGFAVVGLFATFIALHAKDYYLVGLYPLLFAAGSVALERVVRNAILPIAYAGLATALSLMLAPLALPLLSEPAFITYSAEVQQALHLSHPESEVHAHGPLPQFFADMHGWRALADRVAFVGRTLSPADRAGAAVFANNYGEAAAVDVFGDGRIPVISGHNSYFTWGPHGDHSVLIIIGGNKRDHEREFRDVREAAVVHTPYAMPYENDLPIFVARDPKIDIRTLWPRLRHAD